ncbi:MAG: hypothetical protein KatS3mg005_4141 [Bryobacteraceae bacterium]|nr:MAG: hypothetical protein KatS3mg005_4141 [Bryobacteraceae bacterium]
MILIGTASIIGEDGEPTGRHRVVLWVSSRPGEASRLCDCPEGHATQEEALHCAQVQQTLKRIVKTLRDSRSALNN